MLSRLLSFSPKMVNHVVVIGGSYCGLGITHRLLKNRSRIPELKVTLISKVSLSCTQQGNRRGH
jgi:NADH dehydrogenase FAD-containing subunit